MATKDIHRLILGIPQSHCYFLCYHVLDGKVRCLSEKSGSSKKWEGGPGGLGSGPYGEGRPGGPPRGGLDNVRGLNDIRGANHSSLPACGSCCG